jgi:exodeoxyribonuclease VII small subunit
VSFEKNLSRLEAIIKKMEEGECSLDDSLKLFEEGVGLAKECHGKLNEAEQKVKVLLSVNDQGQADFGEFNMEGDEK